MIEIHVKVLPMHVLARSSMILRALAERRVVTIDELTEVCGASEATVRRDLKQLDSEGRLVRVRGGAEAVSAPHAEDGPSLIGQPPFRLENITDAPTKRAIARRAAELCTADDSLIIDGGTTTYFLATALRMRELRILTNSFPVAEFLLHHSRNRILLPGGEVYRDQQVIVSPFHDTAVSTYAATKMLMSAQGIGPAGLMQTDPLLLQTERQLLARADKLVVLAESAKLTRRGPLVLCPLERIDILVTDERIAPSDREMLERAGVRVEIARPATANGTGEQAT